MNVHLAWKRVKYDLLEKSFISPLFLTEILQSDLNNWLSKLENVFVNQPYQVDLLEIVDIPKGKGLVRLGSLLKIEDNIYYNCLVQECYSEIANTVTWSQGIIDYGYIISPDIANKIPFFINHLNGWSNFRDASLELLNHGYTHIVITDITAFYENINIKLLISDLKQCNILPDIINKLSGCLNSWATIEGNGLPQGNSASDVLAKLYMNNIDLALANSGYKHLRYVDDIRIFCKSEIEAKKALLKLIQLLRKRGLNIQSSKTDILSSNQAYYEFLGVQNIISDISKKIEEEKRRIIDSISYSDIEQEVIEIDNNETSIDAIKSTLDKYFINFSNGDFNKSLFHFIINRLIKERDSYALDYCLSILPKHPEETQYILKYSMSFNNVDLLLDQDKRLHKELIRFLKSEEAIYNYQNYQILKWLSININYIENDLLNLCRNLAFNNNKPYYIRSIARFILGKMGNSADIDSLADCIINSTSDIEKSELICCLTKMEKGRKHALFSRIKCNDKDLFNLAIRYAKDLKP